MHFSVVSSFGCSLSVCLRVLVVVVCVCVDAPFFCLELCVRKQDLDTGFPGYWLRVFHMCIMYVCVRQLYTGGSHRQRILNSTICIFFVGLV